MADQETTASTADRATDDLIVVLVLGVLGLAHLLLWMSGWADRVSPLAGPTDAGDWFTLAKLVVAALDLLALLIVIPALLRSRRAPSPRIGFGAGMLAMLTATSGAAFIAHDRFGSLWLRSILLEGSAVPIAQAAELLVLGVIGLLLATAAAALDRPRVRPRIGTGAPPAIVILGLGCSVMFVITGGWVAWTRFRVGNLTSSLFAMAPLSLAVSALLALLALFIVPLLWRQLARSRDRLKSWMPTAGALMLVLLGPALWAIMRDHRFFPTLRTSGTPAITLNGAVYLNWPILLVFAWGSFGLLAFELHDRVTTRAADQSDRRAPVAIAWFGWLAAGAAILALADSAQEIAATTMEGGKHISRSDFEDFLPATGAMTVLVPVFVVAHLLGLQRENRNSRNYLAFRKGALLILTTGVLCFILALLGWWGELGGSGRWTPAGTVWLSAGARILTVATVLFLAVMTVGSISEYARRREPPDPDDLESGSGGWR